MATAEDLADQVRAALGGAAEASWSKPSVLVGTSLAGRVRVADTVITNPSSNATMRFATAELQLTQRAADASAASFVALETAVNANLETYTAPGWWSALAAVRASPTPEIEITGDPERVGLCITFTVSANMALEE